MASEVTSCRVLSGGTTAGGRGRETPAREAGATPGGKDAIFFEGTSAAREDVIAGFSLIEDSSVVGLADEDEVGTLVLSDSTSKGERR